MVLFTQRSNVFCVGICIVIRPSSDNRVKQGNYLALRGMKIFLEDFSYFLLMSLLSLFSRGDKCIKTKNFPLTVPGTDIFTSRSLNYVESKKIESCYAILTFFGEKCMSNSGLFWFYSSFQLSRLKIR